MTETSRRLGEYELLEEMGRGGVGGVYKERVSQQGGAREGVWVGVNARPFVILAQVGG